MNGEPKRVAQGRCYKSSCGTVVWFILDVQEFIATWVVVRCRRGGVGDVYVTTADVTTNTLMPKGAIPQAEINDALLHGGSRETK